MTRTATEIANGLLEKVLAATPKGRRRLVALAGAPASGKSTLATELADRLTRNGNLSKVVPMDGFHLHNQILLDRNLLPRKGAPETFDVAGFKSLVARLQVEPEVICPIFDRERDIAIAGAEVVSASCETVILEGNYLLFDHQDWQDLKPCWDLSIWLDVPLSVLSERLIERWLVHGLSPEEAEKRASDNDLANARLVSTKLLKADLVIKI